MLPQIVRQSAGSICSIFIRPPQDLSIHGDMIDCDCLQAGSANDLSPVHYPMTYLRFNCSGPGKEIRRRKSMEIVTVIELSVGIAEVCSRRS